MSTSSTNPAEGSHSGQFPPLHTTAVSIQLHGGVHETSGSTGAAGASPENFDGEMNSSSPLDRKTSMPNAHVMPPPKPVLEVDLDAPVPRRFSISASQQRIYLTSPNSSSASISVSAGGVGAGGPTPSSSTTPQSSVASQSPTRSAAGSPEHGAATSAPAAAVTTTTTPVALSPPAPGVASPTPLAADHPTASTTSPTLQPIVPGQLPASTDQEARIRYTNLVTALARTHRELANELDTAIVYMRQAITVNKLDVVRAAIQKAERVMQLPEYVQLSASLHGVPTPESAAATTAETAAPTTSAESAGGATSPAELPGIGLISIFEAQMTETKNLCNALQAESATVIQYYLKQGIQSRSREVLKEALLKAESIDKSLLDRNLLASAHSILQELDQRQLATMFLSQALSNKSNRGYVEAACENARAAGLNEENSAEYKEAMAYLRQLDAAAAAAAAAATAATTPQQSSSSSSSESAPARLFKRLFSIGGGSSGSSSSSSGGSGAGGTVDLRFLFGAPISRAVGKFGVTVRTNTIPLAFADSAAVRTAETFAQMTAPDEEKKAAQSGSSTQVPLVVRDCIEHLRARALMEPGLFRLAGNHNHVDELVTAYEAYCAKLHSTYGSPDVTVNVLTSLDNAVSAGTANTASLPAPPQLDDLHDCSNVLKQYFRKLPSPIIPYDHYSKWVDVATLIRGEPPKLQVVSAQPPVVRANEPLRQLRALIAALDAPNRNVLHYLCEFLHQLAIYQDVNKMTEDNIAIVFSPNLLKSKTETMQSLMADASLLIMVVSAMIRFAPYLFAEQVTDDASAPSE